MKNRVSTTISALFAAVILTASALTFAADTPAAPATPAAENAAAAPAAAAPAPDAAAPAAKAEDTENAENPYGLKALWSQGDFIARGTLIILLIMSGGSWYSLIVKIIDNAKLKGQTSEAKKSFWQAASIQAGAAGLKESSPYRYIAEQGIKAAQHHDGALLNKIDLNEWISSSVSRSSDKVNSRLQNGLAFLATVGSTSPFVGLFGTVMGIYGALTKIGIAGQASIDKVAGPVGEALIMTAFGLLVAVPAVLGYNYLVRRNKSSMEDIRAFAADVHLVLVSGKAHPDTNKKAG